MSVEVWYDEVYMTGVSGRLLAPSGVVVKREVPLTPSNDRYLRIVFPETEAKHNVPSIPPADEAAEGLASPQHLTNESPPTIVTTPSLRNDEEPDGTRRIPPSPADGTPTLIRNRSTSSSTR